MLFLGVLLGGVAVGIFWMGIKGAFPTKKGKIIAILICGLLILSSISCIAFGITDTNSSSSSWDSLSKDEKEWYKRNYGDGQYEKYQQAIDDYAKNHR